MRSGGAAGEGLSCLLFIVRFHEAYFHLAGHGPWRSGRLGISQIEVAALCPPSNVRAAFFEL